MPLLIRLVLLLILVTGGPVLRVVADEVSTTAASATADSTGDEGCTIRLRAGDEFWQLSARGNSGSAADDGVSGIVVHQFEAARNEWQRRTFDAFAAGGADAATVFYVHGNRMNPHEAVGQGWQLYDSLQPLDPRPIRMVVWAWPSSQIRGPLRDVRSKAVRADNDAYYFGAMLVRLNPRSQVGILSFSLGARIVTGGLHLAAGGQLCNRALPQLDPTAARPKVGVVLLAAAEHNDWIQPEGLHGRALAGVERLLSIHNSCDPALARYHFVDRYAKPRALGFRGVAPSSLGEYSERVEQRDAAGSIGRTHDESAYYHRGLTPADLRRYLLGAESK